MCDYCALPEEGSKDAEREYCARCAALPAPVPVRVEKDGSTSARCPHCKKRTSCFFQSLEICDNCREEFLSRDLSLRNYARWDAARKKGKEGGNGLRASDSLALKRCLSLSDFVPQHEPRGELDFTAYLLKEGELSPIFIQINTQEKRVYVDTAPRHSEPSAAIGLSEMQQRQLDEQHDEENTFYLDLGGEPDEEPDNFTDWLHENKIYLLEAEK